jgi:hypothetical protein
MLARGHDNGLGVLKLILLGLVAFTDRPAKRLN